MVRPIAFGFSWMTAVWPRKPQPTLLDFLSFPIILSSESLFINGLRGFFRKENFSRLSPGREKPRNGALGLIVCGRRDWSWDKGKLTSDFPQEIVRALFEHGV
jgi:hypothetical protein